MWPINEARRHEPSGRVIGGAEVPMPGRKIRSRSDAQTCLAAAARSGLSRVEWCHANDVDARSLNAWRLNLTERPTKETTALRLVEVVTTPVAAHKPLTLRVGDVAVEVPVGFDEDSLARVLGVLAAC